MQNPLPPPGFSSFSPLNGDSFAILQWLREAGITALATDRFGDNPLAVAPIAATGTPAEAKGTVKPLRPAGLQTAENQATSAALAQCADLAALQEFLISYKGLSLSLTATQAVIGKGQAHQPHYMVIAEAPDAQEDQNGQAFSGQAHQMIEKAMFHAHGTLDDVYFTYLSKWRPPGQRSLLPAEQELAQTILAREIALVQPTHLIILSESVLRGVGPGVDSLEKLDEAEKLTFGVTGKDIFYNIYNIDFKYKNSKDLVKNRALALQKPEMMLRDVSIKKRVWQSLLLFCRTLAV
ncbi:MAG TPA: uracil-DNA glycosylase family protein [Alphaproteobacteria bacterium]